ncbi:hypothetical protein [Halomonas halocynthiae]|uniref:hypothetical protein n=1 Tax=Halomonas halocynthiae TaxID=176290 RepID=UPI00040E974C|nr:hypothetical protein [Halomonas halocynthiae]
MTIAIIWLVAFVFFLYMLLKNWDASVSAKLDAMLPTIMRSHDDRYVLAPASAVLLATAIVAPVEVLMVAIIIGVITLVATKVVGCIMNKANLG